MGNKRIRTALLSTALAGVMLIGGTYAYFTDGDTATNTFTVGSIEIELQEPNWEPPEDITPNETLEKDPQIKNTGNNESYVFLEVTVPYANIVTAKADGTKNAKADTELFSYEVNSGWTQLGTDQNNTSDKTITRVYVYGSASACTALAADATTPALFDKVTFANIVEDQSLEGTTQNLVVNAYAIQTGDINGGKTAPADVWAVLKKQAPSVN